MEIKPPQPPVGVGARLGLSSAKMTTSITTDEHTYVSYRDKGMKLVLSTTMLVFDHTFYYIVAGAYDMTHWSI